MAEGFDAPDLARTVSSGSECDTDREEFTDHPPEPKRSRKHCGAATYRAKFNPDWKKEFSFVTSVSQDPYRQVTIL